MGRVRAEDIIQALGLAPLPVEGGFFRETWRSRESSAIYFLLTPGNFSAIHRLPGDELFHFYLGGPVEMLQLHADGRFETIVIGTDLAAGQRPQVLVPGGTWQGTALVTGGEFALLGTTMAPPFRFEDFEAGEREALVAGWPGAAERIARLTR